MRRLNECDTPPVLIVIDEPFLRGRPVVAFAEELVTYAPIVVIGHPDHQMQIAAGVAEGKVDFVLRDGRCIPMVTALVERALRWESEIEEQIQLAELSRQERPDRQADEDGFPEQALRLLGAILDNLEIVLSDRRRLPTAAVRRLCRMADLAFDLKEGLRLLAGYVAHDSDPGPDLPC